MQRPAMSGSRVSEALTSGALGTGCWAIAFRAVVPENRISIAMERIKREMFFIVIMFILYFM